MRENGFDPIVLDAGDMFFSTTSLNKNNLESEKYRCETMLSGYEKIGCDGLNIGKYELLGGLSYLKYLEESYKKIPFISANIRDKKTKELIFAPYSILEKENLAIGIIGVTNMVPDTMESVIVDDYIKAGNDYIKKISKNVDIIVMLVNSARNTHQSLQKNFKKADFIFVSGSTNRTSSSTPQQDGGPFLYSNGKQGKYLTVIDLDLKNNHSDIVDVSSHEQKIKQVNNRIKRLQRKDPNKSLEQIYAGQENILNLIKKYRSDLARADSALNNASNIMRFSNLPLNKTIKDDPEMLAMVNSAVDRCNALNPSAKKGSHDHINHSRKNKNKKNFKKPPKPFDRKSNS